MSIARVRLFWLAAIAAISGSKRFTESHHPIMASLVARDPFPGVRLRPSRLRVFSRASKLPLSDGAALASCQGLGHQARWQAARPAGGHVRSCSLLFPCLVPERSRPCSRLLPGPDRPGQHRGFRAGRPGSRTAPSHARPPPPEMPSGPSVSSCVPQSRTGRNRPFVVVQSSFRTFCVAAALSL